MDWIDLAQDGDKWRAFLVNGVGYFNRSMSRPSKFIQTIVRDRQ
jgi:hypothetical protein